MSWKTKELDKLAKKEKIIKKSKIKASEKHAKKDFILHDKRKWNSLLKKDYFTARVVEVQKKYVFVAPEKSPLKIDTKDVWLATVAKKFLQNKRVERNFIVVGDRVLCLKSPHEDSEEFPQCTIEYRASRDTQISRIDPLLNDREHILASNISQLVIVASYLNPNVKWGLIDRFLVQAEHEDLKAVIILNKQDLLKKCEKSNFVEECRQYEKIYKKLGYQVISFQASKAHTTKKEQKILHDVFDHNITLISGHSGVGKSSITNLLNPEIEQEVEELEISRKGRHTTTYSSLLKLEKGGFIIDTPGIRSFTLMDLDPVSLSWGFIEMRPFINKCRYRECKHHTEPDCMIIKAVQEKKISQHRYQSYLSILLKTTRREGRFTLE